jgi:hypothetical protein
MKAALKLTAALFIVCVASSRAALGCSCMGDRPVCEAYWQASAVFVGVVTGVREPPRLTPEEAMKRAEAGEWPQRTFTFAVERPLRGVEGAQVAVGTGLGGGDCGYGFRVGERYLVYAYREQKTGKLSTGICTRTRPLARANEDLQYANGLSQAGAGATIFGHVARERRVSHEEGDATEYQPLAGVWVEVEGAGKTVRAETDAAGNYVAAGLPAGEYTVKAGLPETLIASGPEGKVRVEEKGCGVASFYARSNGRLSGRVFDSEGRPAAKVSIRLSDAARGEMYFRGHTDYVTTDAEGRYQFKGIPEGRYILKLRFDGAETDTERPFPTVYHPDVSDAARATAVSIGEGEKVEDYDLHLPPAPAERTVEGVAVYPDGTPAANVRVSYSADIPNLPVGYGTDTDSTGRFVIKVYEGVGLKISVSVRRADNTWANSEVVKVPASGPIDELKLTVPRP